MNKNIAIVLGIVLAAGVGVVAYLHADAIKSELSAAFGAASSAGSTYNTAYSAGAVASLASPGANGTSTSVYNASSRDRYVTGVRVGCEGLGTSKTAYTGTGLSALTFSAGTSSAAAPATLAAFKNIATNVTIPTTTPDTSVASSTAVGSALGEAALWRAGEYITFTTNATNTATCTFSADYLPS